MSFWKKIVCLSVCLTFFESASTTRILKYKSSCSWRDCINAYLLSTDWSRLGAKQSHPLEIDTYILTSVHCDCRSTHHPSIDKDVASTKAGRRRKIGPLGWWENKLSVTQSAWHGSSTRLDAKMFISPKTIWRSALHYLQRLHPFIHCKIFCGIRAIHYKIFSIQSTLDQ